MDYMDPVFHAGYWWQMVVSVGPACRYHLALAGGGPLAAAAEAEHRADDRLACYVGVRPLLLLGEAEVEAAAAAAGSAGGSPAAAAEAAGAAFLPAVVYCEDLDAWNEREPLHARLRLGPTALSAAAGFRGTLELFEKGQLLLEDGYWAKVLARGSVLKLRVKVAGIC